MSDTNDMNDMNDTNDTAKEAAPRVTAGADYNIAFRSSFGGPNGEHEVRVVELAAEGFEVYAVEQLVAKLTGPQGRDLRLGEITYTGSWRAGVEIWGGDGDEYFDTVVVVSNSDVADEFVMSCNHNSCSECCPKYRKGWHIRLSHESLVKLLESLVVVHGQVGDKWDSDRARGRAV